MDCFNNDNMKTNGSRFLDKLCGIVFVYLFFVLSICIFVFLVYFNFDRESPNRRNIGSLQLRDLGNFFLLHKKSNTSRLLSNTYDKLKTFIKTIFLFGVNIFVVLLICTLVYYFILICFSDSLLSTFSLYKIYNQGLVLDFKTNEFVQIKNLDYLEVILELIKSIFHDVLNFFTLYFQNVIYEIFLMIRAIKEDVANEISELRNKIVEDHVNHNSTAKKVIHSMYQLTGASNTTLEDITENIASTLNPMATTLTETSTTVGSEIITSTSLSLEPTTSTTLEPTIISTLMTSTSPVSTLMTSTSPVSTTSTSPGVSTISEIPTFLS